MGICIVDCWAWIEELVRESGKDRVIESVGVVSTRGELEKMRSERNGKLERDETEKQLIGGETSSFHSRGSSEQRVRSLSQ
jgi:hypothetical protein